MRKCLKVEYLGRIEYDFQKSCVTGPWDHKDLVSAKKFKKKFHACVPLKRIHHYNEDLFMLVTHLNYNDVWLPFTVNIVSYVMCHTVPDLQP